MTVTRPLCTGDAAAVLSLETALTAADGTGEHYDLDDVLHEMADPGLDLATDTVGVFDGEVLLAQAWVAARGGVLVLSGGVAPAARRRGHGAALLAWAGRQAAARGLTAVSATVADGAAGAAELFTRAGMPAVRRHADMARRLDPEEFPAGPSAAPAAVPGVVVVPAGSVGDDHLRAVYNAAFAGHFGWEPADEQRWRQWYAGSPNWRPDISLVAREETPDGPALGFALGYEWPADTAATGVREAWLGQLGVVPAARGRGLGSLLLSRFLHAATAAGYQRAGLGVDTENRHAALAMYERAGFTTTTGSTTYRGPLGGWTGAGAEDAG